MSVIIEMYDLQSPQHARVDSSVIILLRSAVVFMQVKTVLQITAAQLYPAVSILLIPSFCSR